jgi:hypothetical protein
MAIGHELHLQAPGGFHLIMMASVFLTVIGKTVIIEWITTIIGTTTEIATTVISVMDR